MYGRYILIYVFYCATVRSEAQLIVRMNVNGKAVSDEDINRSDTMYYNVGDIIIFSCDDLQTRTYYKQLIHTRDTSEYIMVPTVPTKTNYFVDYTITADDFDNNTKVYCTAEMWDKTQSKYIDTTSYAKRLIMNAGEYSKSALTEIQYNEETKLNYTCDGTDKNSLTANIHKIINGMHYTVRSYTRTSELSITPADSGTIVYCEMIRNHAVYTKYQHQTLNLVRYIYNKTMYIYAPMVTDKSFPLSLFSNYSQIGIGIGLVVFFVLVTSLLLLRYKRKKNGANGPDGVDGPHYQVFEFFVRRGTASPIPRPPVPIPRETRPPPTAPPLATTLNHTDNKKHFRRGKRRPMLRRPATAPPAEPTKLNHTDETEHEYEYVNARESATPYRNVLPSEVIPMMNRRARPL